MMAIDFKPHAFQDLIVQGIQAVKRCAIWAGMGLGKTVSTLTALEDLAIVETIYPVLIVAPLRVAKYVWPKEVKKWNHLKHLNAIPVVGLLKDRQAALRVKAPIHAINFEQLPWLVEFYGDKWPWPTVVIDEATKLKGFRLRQGTTRAKALARVAHTKIKRIILLTGTPSPNGLQDLWGQIWFLDKGIRLGRTFDGFKQRWFRKARNGFGTEATDWAQGEIQNALADVCITIDAADWFDLEAPIINRIMVKMPPATEILYKDMEKKFFMEIEGEKIEAMNAAAKSQKLLQLANGAAYIDGGTAVWKTVHDEKLDALEEIVEEAGGMPVLVAYNFKSDLARLKARFKDGIDLAGKDGLERAQRGEGRVWFGHPASMGHGVDGLQNHSNIMAFFGYSWNLEQYLQFVERIGPVRQMQAGFKRPVFMHLIITEGTIDELVLQRLIDKRETQDILLAAMKEKGYR